MNSNQIKQNDCTNGRDDPNDRPHPTCPSKDGTPCYRDFSVVDKEHQNDASFWIDQGIAEKEPPFPVKLHAMLSNPRIQDIITWQPHGRSWRILNKKEFEEKVIPLYFTHNRYASFITQVNGYGFRRITSGIDSNTYFHELFLRGMPHLCKKMRRLTTKDIRNRKKLSENNAPPDFYKLSRENPLPERAGPVNVSADTVCEDTVRDAPATATSSKCETVLIVPEQKAESPQPKMPSALNPLAARYQLSCDGLFGTAHQQPGFTPNYSITGDVEGFTNNAFHKLTRQDMANLIAITSGSTSNYPTINNQQQQQNSDLANLIVQSILRNQMLSNFRNPYSRSY